MDVAAMKNIVLITNIPTPYRVPLFNALSEQLRAEGHHLKVIFSGSGYARRKFQVDEQQFRFDYHILQGGKLTAGKTAERTLFLYRGLGRQLRQASPDLIIVSGYSPATLRCVLEKQFRGIPYIIWSGSVPHERNTSWWRTAQRKFLIRQAAACVAYGSRARQYFLDMGAEPSSISIAINTVDTTFFHEQTRAARAALPADRIFTFLYLGYLIPRKNVGRILEAAARLRQRRTDFRILMVGDGISKPALEAQTEQLGLTGHVQFTGYQQKAALPRYLAESDVFLFQTDFDIWGLVLNETMAAGLPALVSPHAGACDDLLEEGITGRSCNFEDIAGTSEQMEWMMTHPEQVKTMGAAAATLVMQKASLAVSASGFLQAIHNVIGTDER